MNKGLVLSGATCLTGAVVAAVVLPITRAWFRKQGWVDDPGTRKIHAQPTPLSGGLGVLAGVLAGFAVIAWEFRQGWWTPGSMTPAWLLAIGGVALFLLGWWDDVVELRPSIKLSGQMLVALVLVGGGVRLPLFQAWPALQILASVGFFLAIVNAMNFLDNMNGLCAGLGCIAALQLGLISGRWGAPVLTAACWGVAGACAGFIPYNYPKASAFLGDSGSHVIGGAIAVLTMLTCDAAGGEGKRIGAGLAPLWVLVVPGYDLVQVVLGRLRRGQPVYVGDNHHVSHQLVRRGFSRPVAVLVLWAIAAIAGIVGLSWNW